MLVGQAMQMLYVVIFTAVLLGVVGMFLIFRSSTRSHVATERRMREEITQPPRVSPIKLRRDKLSDYGPYSTVIVAVFPAIAPYLAQIRDGRITPVMAALMALVVSLVLGGISLLAFDIPIFIGLGSGLISGFGLPMIVVGSVISGQKKLLSEQLPVAIDLVARGLEAGHPVSVALGLVGSELEAPIGPAFAHALVEINFGLDRKIAMRNLAKKYPDTNLRFFVAAIEMQRETGGDLASVLRNLSRVVRKRENLRKKALALSAEGRATGILVGALPFVIIAAIYTMYPPYYTRAMPDPAFWPFMALAFGLWALGLTWIWRMTNIKV